jgi:hypothetical protein
MKTTHNQLPKRLATSSTYPTRAYRLALGPTNLLLSEQSAILYGALSPCHHSVKLKHRGECAFKGKRGKAIPVTCREGPWSCETSRLPHFLDNSLADGGEVVSPTRRPPFTPRKIPGTHFCYRLSQGHSGAGRIRSSEKSSDHTGNRTRDLPACSIVPQPTTLPRAPTVPLSSAW